MRLINFTILLTALFMITSCASRKDVIYFQNVDQIVGKGVDVKYNTIKENDRLSILVTAEDKEVIKSFSVGGQGNGSESGMFYTVDTDGNIVFPYLGAIHVKGLTRLDLIAQLRKDLSKYIKDPIVNVTLMNFQVTVLGATKGSVLEFENNDRPTILEALAKSGDINITAKRNDILVIREDNGVRSLYKLDVRDANIVNSPGYYLAQNDIIYVEPNRSGIQGNKSTWYLSVGMTVITIALAVINLVK